MDRKIKGWLLRTPLILVGLSVVGFMFYMLGFLGILPFLGGGAAMVAAELYFKGTDVLKGRE